MTDPEESDEQMLPSLLAEMNAPSSAASNAPVPAGPSSWLTSSARLSPAQQGPPRPPTFLPRRTPSHGQPQSAAELEHGLQSHGQQSHSQQSTYSAPPNIFNTSSRSIFASGPPTASVSASLVHASMSSPPASPSANSLSAFAGPSGSSSRRLPPAFSQLPVSGPRSVRLQDIEKDTEDPRGGMRGRMDDVRRNEGTSAAVSQLFATPDRTSPPISRHASYIRTANGTQYTRAMAADTAPLPSHLYTRGLLSGRHSDITVIAFGTRYPLHRLLLDRAPYFCSALSEPWLESSAKEITLHPEEVDGNITQPAFELALKRIYGCHKDEEEDKEPMGLFATGCWLDMADLIEASLNSLLRQLCPANISNYIRLVTSNYYGKHGDRILAAAKAMLCREGWEMPICYFDGISGDIVREIIGSDGFYVPGEWDRYILAKRILNRRLRTVAMDAGLIDGNGSPLISKPESLKFMAIRFDGVYRKTASLTPAVSSDTGDRWLGLYTSPEIAPLLVLLDEGIHYVHLSFEQLQRVRGTKDAMGLPMVPEKVVSDALWMSMELRQRIVNARDTDLELGLAEYLDEPVDESESAPEEPSFDLQKMMTSYAHGQSSGNLEDAEGSESWDFNGKPRKFWVPLADATFPLGGDLEPVVSDNSTPYKSRHMPRISASIDPQDAQWATDFASTVQDRPDSPPGVANAPSPKVRYTHYPPFRFAVEFPSAKNLKEKKRVYSSTVWYAGSLWNVYVQKTVGTRHTQLGVYLHRERQADLSEASLAALRNGSVDERIDQLEREMVRSRRPAVDTRGLHTRDDSASSEENMMHATQSVTRSRPSQDLSTLSGLLRSSRGVMKSSEASLGLTDPNVRPTATALDTAARLDDERDDTPLQNTKLTVPTLPPYFDQRPTTRTFFKIYTPSKSGRVLTVYESGPDRFNFSQSWGWRSSNLILDDALGEVEEDGRGKDARLRFMVVIGNV